VIKINVSELFGKHKMSKRQLALKANIRPNTVNAYYQETVKRIEVEHLEAMCRVFDCQPGDILEYIPDESKGE
jgi:putative transcriptional regulator